MVKYNNKIYKKSWQAIAAACIQIIGGAIMLGAGMFSTMFLLWTMG